MKEVMFFKLPIHDDLDNAAIDLGYDTVQNLSTVPRVSRIRSFLSSNKRNIFFHSKEISSGACFVF